MNPATAGVATGEAEETAPQKEQSLSEEILALMKGEDLPEAAPTEEVPEEVPQTEETEVPHGTGETEEEQPEVAAQGEWPNSAKKRVAEESEKRRRMQSERDTAISERDKANEEAQQLREQLQESNRPRPTREDPIADVYDYAGLKKAKGYYENIHDSFSRALDEQQGSEVEVVTGKKDGQDVVERYTREQASDIKRRSGHVLNNLIPERGKLLGERAKADALAVKVYPQFAENDGDNEWAGFVRDTLAQIPALAQVPDIAMWLGHALVGRGITVERLKKEMGKNGSTGPAETSTMSPTARKILSAPKMKSSPPVAATRVPSQTIPRRGADVEAARKKMKANPGSDEAMGEFIDAKLFRGASRGYEKV